MRKGWRHIGHSFFTRLLFSIPCDAGLAQGAAAVEAEHRLAHRQEADGAPAGLLVRCSILRLFDTEVCVLVASRWLICPAIEQFPVR